MMQIIKPGTKIDFIGKTKIFYTISLIAIAVSLVLIFTKGFNLGIDFAGGTVMHVRFSEPVPLEDIRAGLRDGIKGEFTLQSYDTETDVLIRVVEMEGVDLKDLSDSVLMQLNKSFAQYSPSIEKQEQVGPQVGDELRKKAFYAMLFASIGILLYVAFRFEWLFGLGTIIGIVHDLIIIMGIYCISGKEFNLTVMAALLTAVGYSLNDTIVIYDRIREKIKTGMLSTLSWKELINKSVNETLSRTILTSLLTFMAVFSLFLFGGEVLNGFALVMMGGIIVGTYSSVALSSTFIWLVRTSQEKKAAKPVKA